MSVLKELGENALNLYTYLTSSAYRLAMKNGGAECIKKHGSYILSAKVGDITYHHSYNSHVPEKENTELCKHFFDQLPPDTTVQITFLDNTGHIIGNITDHSKPPKL